MLAGSENKKIKKDICPRRAFQAMENHITALGNRCCDSFT